MPTLTLTARTVKTLAPTPGARVDYHDTEVVGLALRVTEDGHKSWSVRYRTTDGRLRRLTLGPLSKMGLAKARKAAHKAIHAAASGEDPAADKHAARLGETIEDLSKEYIAKHAKKHKRTWRDDQRTIDAEILPVWKHRKVKDLTRREVRERLETIAERAPIMANRVLALIRKMLNFAIERDWIDANVASRIAKPGVERSRERVLTDDEIRLVWQACDAERPAMCALMKLRLVTAQRGGELVKMRWLDIAGDWLTLPAEHTKNKQAHRVPLSALALEVLATVPRVSDEWVFAGRSERQPFGDAKQGGRRIGQTVLAALSEVDPTVEAFDFRGHDLRRTAATRMGEAGIPQADIAKVLNHVEGGPRATAVYNRYAYDREKRLALDTWARQLRAILDAKPADNVIPITRAKTG